MTKKFYKLLFITLIVIFSLTSCQKQLVIPEKTDIEKAHIHIYDATFISSGFTFTIDHKETLDKLIQINHVLHDQENIDDSTSEVVEINYVLNSGKQKKFEYNISESVYQKHFYKLYNMSEVKTQIIKLFKIDQNDFSKIVFQSHQKEQITEIVDEEIMKDIYNEIKAYYLDNDYYMEEDRVIVASANFFGKDENYLTFAYLYKDSSCLKNLERKYPSLKLLYLNPSEIESIRIYKDNEEVFNSSSEDSINLIFSSLDNKCEESSFSCYYTLKSTKEEIFLCYLREIPNELLK